MTTEIAQFIFALSKVHEDGLELYHFARRKGEVIERSTMPVTAFVYEFFLYNSLYSIDWKSTEIQDKIIYHPEGKHIYETYKQLQFEHFIRKLAEKNPLVLQKNFTSLDKVPLDASWTKVKPDSSISLADGEKFFKSLNELFDLVQGSEKAVGSKLDKIFSKIQVCRYFIYLVRSNIFHGTKSIGEIRDSDQRKRIEAYNQFLQSLVSCFFDLSKKVPSFTFG